MIFRERYGLRQRHSQRKSLWESTLARWRCPGSVFGKHRAPGRAAANLEVDAKSYWLYTNDPFDNRKRREAFETFGFEKGLEALAKGHA